MNPDLKSDAAFALLRESWQDEFVASGGMRSGERRAVEGACYPFRFDPMLHEALFKALLAMWPVASRRDVLDAYLTASFNAWLDYRGLYAAPKRYVTAFIPRVTMIPGSLERFLADYPDGQLVTNVRHPGSWLASAMRSPALHREHGGDADAALRIWSASTEASLHAAARFGDRVTIVLFDELVHRTQDVMTHLCATLGLDVHPCLTVPTFNGIPIRLEQSLSTGRGHRRQRDRAAPHRPVARADCGGRGDRAPALRGRSSHATGWDDGSGMNAVFDRFQSSMLARRRRPAVTAPLQRDV